MENIAKLFKGRQYSESALLQFGFERKDGEYEYGAPIVDGQFIMRVTVGQTISARIFDAQTGDEYVLHLVQDAVGGFVGKVRAEYDRLLSRISDECFEEESVFRSVGAKRLIEYAREKYGDELEFLWEKFPENAVLRRKDTGKWYVAVLTVRADKIGLDGTEMVEVADMRYSPERLPALIAERKFLPGYHMNKKNWYSVLLDFPPEDLFDFVDESYGLAVK